MTGRTQTLSGLVLLPAKLTSLDLPDGTIVLLITRSKYLSPWCVPFLNFPYWISLYIKAFRSPSSSLIQGMRAYTLAFLGGSPPWAGWGEVERYEREWGFRGPGPESMPSYPVSLCPFNMTYRTWETWCEHHILICRCHSLLEAGTSESSLEGSLLLGSRKAKTGGLSRHSFFFF